VGEELDDSFVATGLDQAVERLEHCAHVCCKFKLLLGDTFAHPKLHEVNQGSHKVFKDSIQNVRLLLVQVEDVGNAVEHLILFLLVDLGWLSIFLEQSLHSGGVERNLAHVVH